MVAKNYIDEQELWRLERNIASYFDYVEDLLEDEQQEKGMFLENKQLKKYMTNMEDY